MLIGPLDLPERPVETADLPVAVWSAPVVMPTYLPESPDRYPAFLDRRIYQGSSGRVFPLPFHDRISETSTEHAWQGLHLENEYLRVLILPELGGRIQVAVDKRTGYPLFFANPVIKPALVGLAGPWLAGGVEFNWPQHHRPATFLPTAWDIDEADGTVWCSDHDPFSRMKGMHGVRLRPDSTAIELKVRLFNRSDERQTFLWWANVAAAVHADYQSFFPSDVQVVADHAKRAISTFPQASGSYYGVDYPRRRHLDTRPDSPRRVPGDRLDWPRNIPVPTSYMCLDSTADFFGGYDHRADAGFVHWADHHYAVGKKQWTWGDEAFGHTWNRNLAEDGTPYIELMAGVFTDNQPDFSHLAPGETKTFSQHWYPVAGTGPVVAANLCLALGVEVQAEQTLLRFDATQDLGTVDLLVLDHRGQRLHASSLALAPQRRATVTLNTAVPISVVVRRRRQDLLTWSTPSPTAPGDRTARLPEPAREPAAPPDVASVEELYLVGRHLEQYRHATRSPEPYWNEALTRDPGHAPTHTALGARRYREGRFEAALRHLKAAVTRLSMLNPNPEVGEAHYLLGLTLARLGSDDEAYAAFAKSTWLHAWVAAGNLQMAVIDARHGRDGRGLERVRAALRAQPDHLQARDLAVVLLNRLGRQEEAEGLLVATLARDPLDVWARHLVDGLAAERGHTEAQTLLDLALENARIGELRAALDLLSRARAADAQRPPGQTACGVLADYHAAVVLDRLGEAEAAATVRARARNGDRTWNFASRLDDVAALQAALDADPRDATAAALLGHWCYANRRHADALEYWRRSAAEDPSDPVVWRNLGIGAYNQMGDQEAARSAYERALEVAPGDARLVFESDQLLKRIGSPIETRLHRLEQVPAALTERDDLAVEYAHLLVSAGRPDEALAVLTKRRFQPWEGGEGQALRAWERTHLALAEQALASGDPDPAVAYARSALETPASLGEARHPLANPAQLFLTLGTALEAAGDPDGAARHWRHAAEARGDFAAMAPQPYSENTYYSVLAARRLGEADYAEELVAGLADHTERLARTPARIDYFATSLPALLLFEDDLQHRQDLTVLLLRAQLALLGDDATARHHLDAVLAADPSHELALDLARTLPAASRSALSRPS
jgi:tetratricopeptide (TPR) repeat protein